MNVLLHKMLHTNNILAQWCFFIILTVFLHAFNKFLTVLSFAVTLGTITNSLQQRQFCLQRHEIIMQIPSRH